MAYNHILNKNNSLGFEIDTKLTIHDIEKICKTDWVVGTPPERMELGFKHLGINYIEYVSSPEPFQLLKTVLNNGNIPIIRTITQGVPHWIIANGYTENEFNILDPWLGIKTYSIKQLNDIWKVRNYQFYEIITDGIKSWDK